MRRTLYFAVVLLVGCQGVVGPRDRLRDPVPVDVPCLPMDEQQKRIRALLALPDQSPTIAPKAYPDFLGPNGR
jgi:hypothetical protein